MLSMLDVLIACSMQIYYFRDLQTLKIYLFLPASAVEGIKSVTSVRLSGCLYVSTFLTEPTEH